MIILTYFIRLRFCDFLFPNVSTLKEMKRYIKIKKVITGYGMHLQLLCLSFFYIKAENTTPKYYPSTFENSI